MRRGIAGHDTASGAVRCKVIAMGWRAWLIPVACCSALRCAADSCWLMACRKAAGDLEMRLHEVESRSRLDMAKLRVAAAGEAETLAAQVEAMEGQVARLQSVEAGLQRGVLGLLESRRHVEGQVERRCVPKQDLQRASEEIERLQAMIDGLGERLRAKEDEMVKLRETMQVVGGKARLIDSPLSL